MKLTVMLALAASLAGSLAGSGAYAADDYPLYQAGWTPAVFYQEVSACRGFVVAGAISGYVAQAAAQKRTEDSLRTELISIMPAFDVPAASVCFCALNELAKSQLYSDYAAGDVQARMTVVGKRIDASPCAGRLRDTVAGLQSKAAIEAVRLH